jgi:spore germination cell wall hydrolase CwlJ-like protein
MTAQSAYDKPIVCITAACEASNRSFALKVMIIHTIINRRDSGRFQPTLAGVCLQTHQYSEWNADGADNRNLERVANMTSIDPVIVECERAYVQALMDRLDPTHEATHFYATSIPEPYWTKDATLTVEQEGIRFYKNVP